MKTRVLLGLILYSVAHASDALVLEDALRKDCGHLSQIVSAPLSMPNREPRDHGNALNLAEAIGEIPRENKPQVKQSARLPSLNIAPNSRLATLANDLRPDAVVIYKTTDFDQLLKDLGVHRDSYANKEAFDKAVNYMKNIAVRHGSSVQIWGPNVQTQVPYKIFYDEQDRVMVIRVNNIGQLDISLLAHEFAHVSDFAAARGTFNPEEGMDRFLLEVSAVNKEIEVRDSLLEPQNIPQPRSDMQALTRILYPYVQGFRTAISKLNQEDINRQQIEKAIKEIKDLERRGLSFTHRTWPEIHREILRHRSLFENKPLVNALLLLRLGRNMAESHTGHARQRGVWPREVFPIYAENMQGPEDTSLALAVDKAWTVSDDLYYPKYP